jgi:two-component system sensor histidine kinase PilS (NtrC family)
MRDNPFAFSPRPSASRIYPVPAEEELWRSLYFFNLYRLVLGSLLLLLGGMFGKALALDSYNPSLFLDTGIVYIALTLFSLLAIGLRHPRFSWQLALQVGTDIVCLTVLSHASGGVQSGFGMLLLVSLAAAGLISRGRTTLFFAALASIAVLLQHSYAVLLQDAEVAQYLQAGLLSSAYFVIAWLAHTLAKYAIASEKLAAKRGVDLANMAEANRLVIQDTPDGVLVVDASGVVRQCNPSAEFLLGYNFTAMSGVTLKDCSPPLAERFAAWLRDRENDQEVLRLPATNYQVRVRFLPVQREEFWGVVLFLEDMQRAQARARQIKLAALGRLTANIAHEVRNPLSSISYATELLQEEKHDPAQARLFQIILDNAARLNRIVQDVMQLNRRDRAQPEFLRLADLLPGFVTELCQAERVAQDIFRLEAAADCAASFDRGHLDQVLWNVCCNALRYCSTQPGSVQIRAWRSSEHRTMLEIADDGPGVADEAVHQ